MGPTGAKRTPNARLVSPHLSYSCDPNHQRLLPQKLPKGTQSPMAVLMPRIRMINVRLSEEEYVELERFCIASGARSISDLVRSTMHRVVRGGNRDNALASSVNEYSTQVKDLEQRVKELAAELASIKAGKDQHGTAAMDEKDETAEVQLSGDSEGSLRPAIAQKPPDETDS